MKNIFRLPIVLFCLFTTTNSLHAQWVQTNGPNGGRITSFAQGANIVYAGASPGIYQSSDNGDTWLKLEGSMRPQALYASGSIICVGTNDGVYISTNAGQSWILRKDGMRYTDVIQVYSNTNYYYVTTASDGLYRMKKDSTTWVLSNTGLEYNYFYSLYQDGDKLLLGGGTGIYVSTDDGASWNPSSSGFPSGKAVFKFLKTGAGIFAGSSNGVYLSTDQGASWVARSMNLPTGAVPGIVADGNDLIISVFGHGLYGSSDNGQSWILIAASDLFLSVFSLHAGTSVVLAGTYSAGVLRSTDKGTTWSDPNNGIPNSWIEAIAIGAGRIVAGEKNGVYLSSNNGSTWQRTSTTLQSNCVFDGDSYILAGTYDNKIIRTTDDGATWATVYFTVNSARFHSFVSNGSVIFAGNAQEVLKSTDNGVTWSSAWAGMNVGEVWALAFKGSTLFAATGGSVYRSIDLGTSWVSMNNGLPNSVLYSLAVIQDALFVTALNTGVYRSTDDGGSWAKVGSKTGLQSAWCVVSSGTNLFLGTEQSGVYFSTDLGDSWVQVSTNLGNARVLSLAANGTTIFAGTAGSGVWRRPLTEMTTMVQLPASEFPTVFELGQNYPNPFNPATTISFSLASTSFVSLTVFDLIGREQATIVSEEMSPGSYSRQWNADGLPSGVYFYRLQCGAYSETKKFTLLK